MASRQRLEVRAVLGGDILRVLVEFLSRAHELRLVSKGFALVPCSVAVPPSQVFLQLPSCVQSLVCSDFPFVMPREFYPGVARIGRFLARLDVNLMQFDSFDFLAACPALKELCVQGCTVKSGRVIHCPSLVVLDMDNTFFQVGDVPSLQTLSMQECPPPQVLPPSLTSLNCARTFGPLCIDAPRLTRLTRLDLSRRSLASLDFLREMPLKELSLKSCTRDGAPWPLDIALWPLEAALLPHCVKLSISDTPMRLVGRFARLEVLGMQNCLNMTVPDAPLTSLNIADNELSREFIEGLERLPLIELNAAWCDEVGQEIDLSRLAHLQFLSIPDSCIGGEHPLYGFPPNVRVVRFSEGDLSRDLFEGRVLGLPPDAKVYVRSFDSLDPESLEQSGMEGAWKSVPTQTLQQLRSR